MEIISTAVAEGRKDDFQLFKESKVEMREQNRCLAVSGYQGLTNLQANSLLPQKKSKQHSLSKSNQVAHKVLAASRTFCQHVIGKLNIAAILCLR